MEEGVGDAYYAACDGTLRAYLETIPSNRWTEKHLNLACIHDGNADAVKMLIARGFDVNNKASFPLIFSPVMNAQPRITEALCAAGADLTRRDAHGNTALQAILHIMEILGKQALDTARVLVANGARISTTQLVYVGCDVRIPINASAAVESLLALERCVDRCRSVVVALLVVKDAGRLWRWDRFLLAHISHAVWSTRAENGWQ